MGAEGAAVAAGDGPAPSRPRRRIHEAAKAHKAVEQELAHAVNTSALALSEALSNKAASTTEVSGRGGGVMPPDPHPQLDAHPCNLSPSPPPPSFSAGTRPWRWC